MLCGVGFPIFLVHCESTMSLAKIMSGLYYPLLHLTLFKDGVDLDRGLALVYWTLSIVQLRVRFSSVSSYPQLVWWLLNYPMKKLSFEEGCGEHIVFLVCCF